MKEGQNIRCYDYVNRPYERVRDALHGDAVALFHRATKAAASRAGDLASALHVQIAGLDISTEIAITVAGVVDEAGTVTTPPTTRLQLQWEAASKPRLFPFMQAELAAYRLTAGETQLDFSGQYDPPMGAVGQAVDSVIAHKLAEASVHRFLGELAEHLKRELASQP